MSGYDKYKAEFLERFPEVTHHEYLDVMVKAAYIEHLETIVRTLEGSK